MNETAARLATNAVFGALSEKHLSVVAHCARRVEFGLDETVFRSGEPADAIHVLEAGRVSMQLQPASGEPLLVDSVGPGDILGVSWMLPPYRWTVDAVATLATDSVRVDAACLRDACDADPALGHQLHRAFAGLVRERLVSTRLQLLDVYRGHGS